MKKAFGILVACLSLITSPLIASSSFITIKNGYFWDPSKNNYWYPHGIAYQTWNKALGIWQTKEQIAYDLQEMRKMGVNSIRVDFAWKYIEDKPYNFKKLTKTELDAIFDRYDFLIKTARKNNIRIFALIGYQWPPAWFPDEWYTKHPPDSRHPRPWLSDIMSYENRHVRGEFSDFVQAVAKRYKDNPAIAGWIVGNEFGYLGLWSMKFDGYDSASLQAFQGWLKKRYENIDTLNRQWKTHFPNFTKVEMPLPWHNGGEFIGRDDPSWHDLIQWREDSIADFVAFSTKEVRSADPNHLITYSAVGMQWGEEDWRYHAEDATKIARACVQAGTPLDFWSINNFPWGQVGHESITGKWGIVRARHDSDLPVMYSETGFTTTETMFAGMDGERQARLLTASLWEAVAGGAIGVHVFTWNDRLYISEREKGFGIVYNDRRIKSAYWAVRDAFTLMDQLHLPELISSSHHLTPDVAFLWTNATDSIYNRYTVEMMGLFGALERLGLEPTFINREELLAGDFKKYKALILPRNQKTYSDTMSFIAHQVIPAGVHVHANADLPGTLDQHSQKRTESTTELLDMFGLDITNAKVHETPPTQIKFSSVRLVVDENSGSISSGDEFSFDVWKYTEHILAKSGKTIASYRPPLSFWNLFTSRSPALHINDLGTAKTAITTFSLGDIKPSNDSWAQKYDWLHAIYIDQFQLKPQIVSSNKHVLVDGRILSDGSLLISARNYLNSPQEVKIQSNLIEGKEFMALVSVTSIEKIGADTIDLQLNPLEYQLIVASPKTISNKIFITNAPPLVRPLGDIPYAIEVRSQYDDPSLTLIVSFKEDGDNGDGIPDETYSTAYPDAKNPGRFLIHIPLPSNDDLDYTSSNDGGRYLFQAVLKDHDGRIVAQTNYATQLYWGVKLDQLPSNLQANKSYKLDIRWEGLYEIQPGGFSPLERSRLFPGRIGVFRSRATEKYYPQHITMVNHTLLWLEKLGYQKSQLVMAEQPKGYYILDEQDLRNVGFLKDYFSLIILPGAYVMDDEQCQAIKEYVTRYPRAVLITGGVAGILRPDGSDGSGRIETLFGMGTQYKKILRPTQLIFDDKFHYITQDLSATNSTSSSADGDFFAWSTIASGGALAHFNEDNQTVPALIFKSRPLGGKTLVTNMKISNPNTLDPHLLMLRQIEWMCSEPYAIKLQLKSITKNPYDADLTIITHDFGTIEERGQKEITITIPDTELIKGETSWVSYCYPWNSTYPWRDRLGFDAHYN